MPEASKPNGVDHNPGPGRGVPTRLIAPNPRPTKARRHSKFNVQTAERRLIEAMQGSPGLSVAALAKTTSTSRSTTGEWLRQLAARGAIEKDPEGRWRLKGEEPRPTEAREQPDPTIAPSS